MKRFPRRSLFVFAMLTVLLYGTWRWLLRSEWLRMQLRARAVQEIEKATGGRAELGRLDFDPSLLGARFDRFVLHGTEPASAAPLVLAERIEVGLKVRSLFRRDVDLERIEIVRPRVTVTVDAEGRTNLPTPVVPRAPSGRGPVEELLRLAVDTFVIRDGEFS